MSLMLIGSSLWTAAAGAARRVPALAWSGLAALLLMALALRWHHRAIDAAFTKGAQAQAATDRAAVLAATAAATRAQDQRIAALTRTQMVISKGADDALAEKRAAVVRHRDDLRLRWAAARAAAGGAGTNPAIAVPAAATVAVDTACAAAGWVAFDTAAAAAAAADDATAKDDAWIAWVTAQQQAWPGE